MRKEKNGKTDGKRFLAIEGGEGRRPCLLRRKCAICSVMSAVCSVKCAVCTLPCGVCNVQVTLKSVHCRAV